MKLDVLLEQLTNISLRVYIKLVKCSNRTFKFHSTNKIKMSQCLPTIKPILFTVVDITPKYAFNFAFT